MKKVDLLFPVFFCFSFLIISCSSEKVDKKEVTASEKTDSVIVDTENINPAKTNFIIVPGVSFGDILPTSSEKDLIKIFGEENVIRDSIYVGEGFRVFGTKIFKDDADEILITWVEGAVFEKPERITVNALGSNWQTENGIKIGTPLKVIQKLNGKSFSMAGFGWDYSGTILNWNGGKLEKIAGSNNENMILRLGDTPNTKISQEEYFQLLGDKAFDSSNEFLQTMNPMVYQMVFTLNQK